MGVAQVRRQRRSDEAREIRAEDQDHDGEHDLGHEEHDAADEIGHVCQIEAVGRNHQRGQDHQPVGQAAEHAHGIDMGTALLQEVIDPRLLGDDTEVDGAQSLHDREAHGLRDNPADDEDDDREQQPGQENADLMQRLPDRLEQHVDVHHILLFQTGADG